MPETMTDMWGNTLNAAAAAVGYSGMGEIHFLRYFLGLGLVLVLALAAGWVIKKYWPHALAAPHDAPGQVLYLSQFNTEQTIMLCMIKQTVHCFILRGEKVEMATPLPDLMLRSKAAVSYGPGTAPALSFKSLWQKISQSGKDKQ